MIELHIDSQSELSEVAETILQQLANRSVIAFYGEMGAGKTTLIREIVAAKGSYDTVTSPTFALVNHYSTEDEETIYHFDFYRIERPEEAFDFGYEEYFYSGNLCLVEWPEKIEALLPEGCMVVRIVVESETERRFMID